MKKATWFTISILLFTISFSIRGQENNPKANFQMAITIDDLPVNTQIHTIENKQEITKGILEALKKHQAPAIGFVNEGKLYNKEILQEEQVRLLEMWLEYGMDLGNHGFNHSDINRTSLEEYTDEIISGEKVTRGLMEKSGKKFEYYRHPFLHTGNTDEKKAALSEFLKNHQYIPAPVTIDNSEWIYARAYENAWIKKDEANMKKIGTSYVEYMVEKTAYYEKQSVELFGYQINQILLIHANRLNADYLDPLIGALAKQSYSFISLAEALEDEAYKTDDQFVGNGGISWLHRWALTQGKKGEFFKGEPLTPEFVQDIAGIQE